MTIEESSEFPAPPAPFRRRQASLNDLQEATDFFNICEIDEFGAPDYETEEVEEEWSEIDLGRDLLLLEIDGGNLIGSMTVTPRGGGIFEASGYVHPEHRDRGIGGYIVDWSEHRASQDGVEITNAESLLVRNWVGTNNESPARLLGDRGYTHTKRFMKMEIELADDPGPAAFPTGIELAVVDLDRDLEGIYAVVDDSFSEHWSGAPRTYDDWRKFALGTGFDATLWMQAFRDGKRVGVAIGRNLAGYGWIQWVGVLKAERGMGLGSALLRHQFHRYWNLGVKTIGLGVDSENTTGAMGLYLKAGMKLTRSYDAYEKKLRPAKSQN